MRLRPANLTPHASPLDEARAAVARAKANGPLRGVLARFEALWQAGPHACAPLALKASALELAGGTPAESAAERALLRREQAAALHALLCEEAARLAGAAL